jgi:hypothetical protein
MLPVDPIARTVLMMMARSGGDATLVAPTGEPVYDPETSTVVSPQASYPIRVLVFDYILKTQGIGTMDSTLIRSGDKQVFVKPSPDVPTPKARIDSIIFQGHKYNIVVVKELNPSGSNVVLYELYARE